ncbi:MAG: dCMP deaminase family protein [Candidatus Magasanikbacteria bacterium]|nr:dCMP deaminase family protein [Candidatus Magasanikbacteria bacterium]
MTTLPRSNAISWDECFMRMAHVIAERSKDPSSQVGAVIANQHNVVMGLGYNGFPRGIHSDKFPWEREGKFLDTKYAYICHAEENAVYNSNIPVRGCKVFTTMFPCNECAKMLVQNGVAEIIFELDKYPDQDIFIAAKRLFDAAGVKYREYKSAWAV